MDCYTVSGGRSDCVSLAYCPDGRLEIDEIQQTETGIEVQDQFDGGRVSCRIGIPERPDRAMLHCKTTINPVAPLLIPFWPRDVIPLGKEEDLTDSEGVIYTKQVGLRAGMVYFSLARPKGGSVLYFQNLTSLNDYARQTETSLSDTVGGEWPELGFALPGTTEKPIEADRDLVISDAYMIFSPTVPKDDLEMAPQFLDMLAQVFLALPRNETEYVHWPEIAKKSLRDLEQSEKCTSEVRGRRYLNAYVGDYDNPPESMVQLTALLPLLEYKDWCGVDSPLNAELLGGLPNFFDEDAKVLGRWIVVREAEIGWFRASKEPGGDGLLVSIPCLVEHLPPGNSGRQDGAKAVP